MVASKRISSSFIVFRWALVPLLLCGFLLSAEGTLPSEAKTLTGSVQTDAYLPAGDGEVRHAGHGGPVSGARVSIPALGYQTTTDAEGRFDLPETLPNRPVILSIAKPGFAPESRTLVGTPDGRLRIQIREQVRMVIIDQQLRHLGDGRYAEASAGAGQFRGEVQGATLVFPFTLQNQPVSGPITLTIGTVIGLDTPQAHAVSGNPLPYASSPTIVRLNGAEIAYLHHNGDGQRIPVPASRLNPRGVNYLEVEAGYHTPGGTRIDYDDLELMHLSLEL